MFAKYSLSSSLFLLLFLLIGWAPQQAVAAPATHFLVTVPANATAGTPFNITVTAQDAANATDTTYAGTVHFTSTDPAATQPADSTLTSGVGTFSVTLKTSGPQTVTVTDTVTASITGTSGQIAVSSSAADHFTVVAPAAVVAGTASSVTVTALDRFNNTATGYGGTVHFTSTDSAATRPADSTLPGGVGTFPVTFRTAGNRTVTATDTIAVPSITGTSNTVVVSPDAATHFSVAAPASATAGTAFSAVVTALDQSGNTATGYGGTVHFTSSDPSAAVTLPADTPLTSGVGTFSVTLKTAGSRTVTATDTAASSVTGTSSTITIGPGAATRFTVVSPTSATAGVGFSVTVTALDQSGNTATGYGGTVHFTSTDQSATLPVDTTLTGGVGTFPTVLNTVGSRTVTAMDTATASITGTSNTVVSPGPATHFSVAAPASATAGTAFSAVVTALDQSGNTATGYGGTVHFTSSDPSAAVTLPADTPLTSGVGTFSVTLKTAGSRTVTATDTATLSVTGTSGTVAVSPTTATHLTITAPTATNAGIPFSVTVTALDQFNNTATGYTGPLTLTSTDPAVPTLLARQALTGGVGSFSVTLYTSGSRTVTATDLATAALTATSGAISVSSDATIHFQVSAPTSATAGTASGVTVTAQDQFGNTVPGYGGTVHFTSSDPAAVLPADTTLTDGVKSVSVTLKTAGTQTVTATDTAASSVTGTSGTIVVNNVAPTISTVAPTPVTAGGPGFTITVTNTDSSYVSGSVIQWNGAALATTFGSAQTLTAAVPASLIATAGSANVTVSNPAGGGVSAPATVLIDNPTPDLSTGSLSPGGVVQGSPSFTLTVTGLNFISSSVVLWNGSPRPTSFLSATQLAAAIPATDVASITTAQVTVTTPDPNVTAGHTSPTSLPFTVSALPPPTLTKLSPSTATVGAPTLTLTLTGTGFRSGAKVSFGPTTLDPSLVSVVSSTQITAQIGGADAASPSTNLLAASGAYPVQVTNSDGTQSVALPFTVSAQGVTISALTPASATVGAATLTLTITGTGFRPDTQVTFGGKLVTVSFVSTTQITASIGATLLGSVGTSDVQAINPDGSKSGTLPFTVSAFPVPTLTSLSPSTATVGDPTLTLTLTGTGFRSGAKVSFGPTTLDPSLVNVVSSTQITAQIGGADAASPSTNLLAASGAYPVQVTNSDGSQSGPLPFTVKPQAVALLALTPGSATVGDSTLTLTLTGTGFRSGAKVSFGPTTLDPSLVSVVSSTQITAQIGGADAASPSTNLLAASGAYPVQVTNSDGTQSVALPFTVKPQTITINALSPTTATVVASLTQPQTLLVSISGAGFRKGASVTFTGTSASNYKTTFSKNVNIVSSTLLTLTVGASDAVSAPGVLAKADTYQVEVTNPDGTVSVVTDSNGNSTSGISLPFVVTGQSLTLGSPVPPSADVENPLLADANDSGFIITINAINGTQFVATPTVNFGVPKNPKVSNTGVKLISPTVLTATVGAELVKVAGTYPVTVTNPDGSFYTFQYRVNPLGAALTSPSPFDSGLQLFSVPYDYDNDLVGPNPTEGVFHFLGAVDASGALLSLTAVEPNIKLAAWDPSVGLYALSTTTNSPMTLRIGQSYWVRFPSGVTNGLIRKGVPAQDVMRQKIPVLNAGDYPVSLAPGWNMIGDPFTSPVLTGSLKVHFGGQDYSYTDAVSLGLISGTLYSYDSAGGKYSPQDGTKTLDPYVGYWILASQSCTLLVPQP